MLSYINIFLIWHFQPIKYCWGILSYKMCVTRTNVRIRPKCFWLKSFIFRDSLSPLFSPLHSVYVLEPTHSILWLWQCCSQDSFSDLEPERERARYKQSYWVTLFSVRWVGGLFFSDSVASCLLWLKAEATVPSSDLIRLDTVNYNLLETELPLNTLW